MRYWISVVFANCMVVAAQAQDWRWGNNTAAPLNGDYNTTANWNNNGNSPDLPSTSNGHVYIGIGDYQPGNAGGNIITINGTAYAQGLTIGSSSPNNQLIVQSGGLTTSGQFDIGMGGNTFQQTGGTSTLTGGGTYVGNGGPSGGTSQFLLDGGTVKTLGNTLTLGWGTSGYLRLASGTTLDLSTSGTQSGGGGRLQVGGNGQVGTVDIQSGATVYIGENAMIGLGGSGNSTVNQAAGTTVTINGHLQPGFYGSGNNTWIQNGGTTVVNSNLRVTENGSANGGYTLNDGTLTLSGMGDNNYIAIGSPGFFNQNGGTVTFSNTLYLSWSAAGTYNLAGGTLNVPTITKNAAGYAFNFTGGTLSADTVSIDLTNAGGTLAPGRAGTTGKTQVNGTYTVSSASALLAIQLAGTGQGTTYDWLSASGAVTLDGNLIVSLVGFTPAGGDTFTVVTGSSVSGTFVNAPVSGNRYNLGGGRFTVTYNADSVVLSDYQALANAVDNDGGETEVHASSAKIRGTLLRESATPTTCKFYWWESGSATTNIVDMGTRAVGETFTNQLLGLSQSTTYYYKTYCTNASGEEFAPLAESFTTYGKPTVQNLAPTSVDSSSATVQGQLTGVNNGDAAIYWGLTDGGTNAANWGHTNSFPGQVPNVPFSVGLSSLTSFTNYYYRCYATNAYGAAWASATTNFFTQSATHDWRWSTPGGGDYRAGTNYNGGTQVAMPPTSADHVYIGISTYPAARYDNIVTINAPSYASYLTLGSDGTNNTLIVQSGGLTTAGQFDIGGGGNTFQQTGGNSVLTGGNTYTGNGGGSSSTSSFLLDGGSVKTMGYTLYIGYSYNSYLRIQSGATLDTSTAGTQSGGGGNLEINGGAAGATWDLEAGAVVYIGGSLNVGHNGNGIVNQAGGMLTVNGNLAPAHGASGNLWTQNGGTNTVAGQFRLDASGVYALNGGVLSVNGGNSYLAVDGTGSATLNQSGGTATFQTLDIGYTGNNGCAGVYNVSGGTLNADVLQKNSNGSSALNLTGRGVLSADTVNFDLSNASGAVAPGQANTTGKTQVNGTYSNGASATVQIQLAGTGQGTTYDWLSVSGTANLAGNLSVNTLEGYTPADGDTFTVVTGSSVSGTFANAPDSGRRYTLGNSSFVVTYNADSVVLSNWKQGFPPGMRLIVQ